MKKSLIWFCVGILIIGLGIGISIIEFMSFTYQENIPSNYSITEKNYDYTIDQNYITNINITNAEYQIISDSNVNNIKIKLSYYSDYKRLSNIIQNGNTINIEFNGIVNMKKTYSTIKNMLKEKTFFGMNDLYSAKVTIFINPNYIDKIKIN